MKMKITSSTLLIILIIAFAPSSYAASLHEDLEIAYKKNPTLKASIANLKSIDEVMSQAYSGWMPTISASYNISRESETVGFLDRNNTPKSQNITISQPIYNGGHTMASIKQAKSRINAGRAEFHNIEQQVLFSAIRAYLDLVHAREVLRLSIDNEKVLQDQLEETEDRFKLGETTITDVAQSKSRLAQAVSERITAEGREVTSEAQYEAIFGEKPSDEMAIPEILPPIPNKLDDILKLALENNPLLRIAAMNREMSDSNVDITMSRILPSIDLSGQITRNRDGGIRQGAADNNMESVRLNVTVPIYQSGAEYSGIREAKHQAESRKHTLEERRKEIISNSTRAWKSVATTRANLAATQAGVDANNLALEGVKQEQEIGSRTTLDVLNAEQELFVANINHITARRDEALAAYDLMAVIGDLTAENLDLEVELFDIEENYNRVQYKMIGF